MPSLADVTRLHKVYLSSPDLAARIAGLGYEVLDHYYKRLQREGDSPTVIASLDDFVVQHERPAP